MNKILSQKALVFLMAMGCLPSLFAQEVKKEVHGINLEYMDKTVKPSDNFFRFVNGTWLDTNEIPADRTRWGSFDELREKTDKDMMLILKEALNNPSYTATSDQGKALNL
jgi:putative endopeptidase